VVDGVPTRREKVCIPLKGIEGSNPSLSANTRLSAGIFIQLIGDLISGWLMLFFSLMADVLQFGFSVLHKKFGLWRWILSLFMFFKA
jgi:hypothetical protein